MTNNDANLDDEMYEEGNVLNESDRQDETDGESFGAEDDNQDNDQDDDILREAADIVDAVAEDNAKEDENITPEEESYRDQLARERADFINFRNRARDDQAKARKYGVQDAVKDLLPVMDEIDRARDAGDIEDNSPFDTIAKKFEAALEKLGLTKFGASSDAFDPAIHEAFMNREPTDDDSIKAGDVLVDKVIEPGYKQGDAIVRTAKVSTISA